MRQFRTPVALAPEPRHKTPGAAFEDADDGGGSTEPLLGWCNVER